MRAPDTRDADLEQAENPKGSPALIAANIQMTDLINNFLAADNLDVESRAVRSGLSEALWGKGIQADGCTLHMSSSENMEGSLYVNDGTNKIRYRWAGENMIHLNGKATARGHREQIQLTYTGGDADERYALLSNLIANAARIIEEYVADKKQEISGAEFTIEDSDKQALSESILYMLSVIKYINATSIRFDQMPQFVDCQHKMLKIIQPLSDALERLESSGIRFGGDYLKNLKAAAEKLIITTVEIHQHEQAKANQIREAIASAMAYQLSGEFLLPTEDEDGGVPDTQLSGFQQQALASITAIQAIVARIGNDQDNAPLINDPYLDRLANSAGY